MDFTGKRVLVMGLGLQGGGVGVARFLAEKGAKVTVTDLKSPDELEDSIVSLSDLPINFVLGEHREKDFKNTDLVIRNPDVPWDSPFLAIARQKQIPIEMDESLFLKLWPNKENIIGITGTRGKTTTTNLLGAFLKKAGFPTLLGGNLRGIATLSLLDRFTPETKVVLELSSWQLEGLGWDKISPHIALITNIYPDHLNRYRDPEEYINDKKLIFINQEASDYLFLNQDDQIVKGFAQEAKSQTIFFSSKGLSHSLKTSFRLAGPHNLEDLAAAYAVGKFFSLSEEILLMALQEFKGVPMREEEIRRVSGVTFINDTTATAPIATIMALRTFASKGIILICGGASKNLPLGPMAEEISKHVKAICLLEGTATDQLEAAIKMQKRKTKILGRFSDFRKAIESCYQEAKPNDVVILSPGCASFGMFINEFDRGEKFNHVVSLLPEKA
jgi:UDP-N-acetylmuramoylalanine--D-glutamate ligase